MSMKIVLVLISCMMWMMTACSPTSQTASVAQQATLASTSAPTLAQAEQNPQSTLTQEQAAPPPTVTSSDSSQAIPAAAYNGPVWTKLPLIDSRTGKNFTFADFAGKTVYVEPMATWCPICKAQLPNVETARTTLNSDTIVFIGLSVAENIDSATLTQYIDANGWNFSFAVASDSLTQGLVDSFGRTAVTPPSTPHFIIRPDGSLTDIVTGSKNADEIIAEIKQAAGV